VINPKHIQHSSQHINNDNKKVFRGEANTACWL